MFILILYKPLTASFDVIRRGTSEIIYYNLRYNLILNNEL